GWRLGRVITVVDRGFASEENLRIIQRAGGHYIAGEKLRAGKREVAEALGRGGRYQQVKANLHVKEIVVGDGEARRRYVLVYNPEQAKRDRLRREKLVDHLEAELAQLKTLPSGQHTKAVCALLSHPPTPATWRRPGAASCASTGPGCAMRNALTANTCCAPPTTPCPLKTSPWAISS